MRNVPTYLTGYEDLWRTDPRGANREWFRGARYGLFIHYGLYSQLGAGEWAQYHQRIPVAEYARLKDTFRPDKFDADFITDLALEAGMKYVNLVTCHHDSFCLWDSKVEPFNSVNSPAGRDLVREVAEQCDKKGLGFFTYYTFMLNWRHPDFLSRDYFEFARPDYAQPQPEYRFRSLDDYPRYVEYMLGCLEELLALEYPLAGVWLDIIYAYYVVPHLVPIDRTYGLIRERRPEALIAYKQGATGDEDYASPEHTFRSLAERFLDKGMTDAAERADRAWEINRHKHNEICTTLQNRGWGFDAGAHHMTPEELWSRLEHALRHDCNLLANVGPLPDGSIHEEDVRTLRAVGKRIQREGWPDGGEDGAPDADPAPAAAP